MLNFTIFLSIFMLKFICSQAQELETQIPIVAIEMTEGMHRYKNIYNNINFLY